MLDCREFEKRLYEPDEDTAGFDVELLTHAQDCPACREKLAAQQELLNLLDRHSFVDCTCRHSPAEFMRVNFIYA